MLQNLLGIFPEGLMFPVLLFSCLQVLQRGATFLRGSTVADVGISGEADGLGLA